MKLVLLLLTATVVATSAFSQHDSLLRQFKYRIDHFRGINLSGSGGSQYNQAGIGFLPGENTGSGINLGGNFFALKSTNRQLFSGSGSLGVNFNHSRQSSSGPNNYRATSYAIAPGINLLNKWFNNQRFVELGTMLSSFNGASKNYESNVDSESDAGHYSLQLNTGIGIGRLENVTDMQNALWLNKALTAANRLGRELTADELMGLGRAITRANNTRILDQRRRTQFVLATVDGYLQQQGLVSKNDIDYFSNLNDILFFAFNNNRLSGTEKFLRFTPVIEGSNRNQSGNVQPVKFEDRFTTKTLLLSTGINKFIANSLVHQNNYGMSAQVKYGWHNRMTRFTNTAGNVDENKISNAGTETSLRAFYTHALYPNTRTIISGNIESVFGYYDDKNQNNFFGSANLSCIANYFISYRTRFTMEVGAGYQENTQNAFTGNNYFPSRVRLYANAGLEVNL